MESKFLRLNVKDLVHGLAIAVLAVVLGGVQQGVQSHGFSFAEYDWSGILDLAWKAAGLYLSKKLLSTEDNKVLGAI